MRVDLRPEVEAIVAHLARHPEGVIVNDLHVVLGARVGESRLARVVAAGVAAGLVEVRIERRLARDCYRRPQQVAYLAQLT